jgi:cell fate regulator YaaT (PSP1 superfamily)
VEVAFKGNRKEFFLWELPQPPAVRSAVIVEADRGEDLGRVHSTGELAITRIRKCAHGHGEGLPSRRALRSASRDDVRRERELRDLDEDARRRGMQQVRTHGLVMKLSDAEWQWDGRKLTFYFTAEKRVDFRKLVRDLASTFRARIELKQIGVRDEAKRLDGVGRCGRQYCSASWLPELRPVNLGVAKDQRLSLNPSQISGACGRLMCCLRYEHEFYAQSRKRFPKEGKIIVASRGEEKILANDIFRDRVTLRNSEGDLRVVALLDLRAELESAANAAGGETSTGATASQPVPDWVQLSGRVLPLSLTGGEQEATDPDDNPEVDYVLYRTGEFRADIHGAAAAPEVDATDEAPPEAQERTKRRRGRRGGRRSKKRSRGEPGDGDTSGGNPSAEADGE